MTAARTRPSPSGEELVGLWRRSLLIDTDGSQDTTTEVYWLQSDGLFVDLRQPAGRPDFSAARRLTDLTGQQQAWLAGQEGFAGNLLIEADHVQWVRQIDLQPAPPVPDAGRLEFVDEVLYEYGVHADYVEHWQRTPDDIRPVWSLQLTGTGTGAGTGTGNSTGYGSGTGSSRAVLVVVGRYFGWARSTVPGCGQPEILLGEIDGDRWQITRSSRPYRETSNFTAQIGPDAVQVSELDDFGHPMVTQWSIAAASPHVPFAQSQGAPA